MECNYTVQEGELILNNSRENKFIAYFMFFIRLLKGLLLIFTFSITLYLTYIIFRKCITNATLITCIPLGSIFATFGSAVISVLSLYCNKQINLLKNPQITFKSDSRCLTIALPTCTADFYDLPIFVGIIKMICFYRHFFHAVLRLKNMEQPKDLFIFHCTLMIYRNIIRYKTGTFLMLVGSEFVLSSIIFSFFYQPVSEFISLTAAYF